ncbi:hypothetical protein CYMTET_26975 [Cymbomonas tetramitiformis]|uniref:ADP-ribosylation factor-like protein 2-binding protein n=1 Tax=Cymbomonas tetramitiformis TaxID=36881 RepID=A0AAE0FS76_9CHLO|nr:hypothetical protein CYMTET_26975 [Cymbomonas tetramitiformis]
MAAAMGEQMCCLSLGAEGPESLRYADCGDDDEIDIVDGDGDCDEDEDLEFVDSGDGQSPEDNKFDEIVGALEEVIIGAEFESQQTTFCQSNCTHFDADGENKLIYTDIFSQYTTMLEASIVSKLSEMVPGFDMGEFGAMLNERKAELEGDVFDMLFTLSDFEAFKELMVSYKKETTGLDAAELRLSGEHMHLFTEEQEDGEERPDLNMSISITSSFS